MAAENQEAQTSTYSTMSKKAAIAGMAITSIGASSDWMAQAFIAGVAAVAIIVQGVLDWRIQTSSKQSQTE